MNTYGGSDARGSSTLPKHGETMSDAVDTFFDRAGQMLPYFVSRKRALLASLAITLGVFVVGLAYILEEKKAHVDQPPIRKFRWIVMLCVLLIVCQQLQGSLADLIYAFQNFRWNSQHFTNLWWLEKYMKAVRS